MKSCKIDVISIPAMRLAVLLSISIVEIVATCCSDGEHCCPAGYYCSFDQCYKYRLDCDKEYGSCVNGTVEHIDVVKNDVKVVVCPGSEYVCPDGNTCCPNSSRTCGCCPL